MLTVSCLCGRVAVTVAKRRDFIHACNCCDLCRKSGARWGNFDPADVTVTGDAAEYRREDKAEPAAHLRFCATCGSVTHWTLTDSAIARFGDTLMGVNMWLADEDALAGIELRYPDGRNRSGAGPFDPVREARILGV